LEAAAKPDEELREAALVTVRALAMPLAQHPEQLLPTLLRAASDANREARTLAPLSHEVHCHSFTLCVLVDALCGRNVQM
jgi:hypothetical protein